MLPRLTILTIFIALNVTGLADDTKKDDKKIYSGKKLKALLITGGCCHNYIFQSTALTTGIEEKVNVEFTVINEGGTGTKAQIPLYDNPDWAKPYDVIVHNECFANTVDPEYIKKITRVHEAGKPAVVIHIAQCILTGPLKLMIGGNFSVLPAVGMNTSLNILLSLLQKITQ